MVTTFYRVYRPKKFADLIGQKEIRKILEKSIAEDRINQAYLFTGPRGTGKTTTARIFAKSLNCLTSFKKRGGVEPCGTCSNCKLIESGQTLDLVEIDAASYTGVDNIRQITENINLAPTNLKYRIFIIDEVHMLSKGAFNALLKTLEEPPAHAIFILATTEYSKVPPTVVSRCQSYFFRLFKKEEIISKLKRIAEEENLEVEEESLNLVAEAADGGMRDAESIFAQIASAGDKKITKEEVLSALRIANKEDENTFLDNLFQKKTGEALLAFDLLVNQGIEPFLLSHRLLEKLRKILLLKINSEGEKLLMLEISEGEIEKMKNLSKKIGISELSNLMMKILQSQPLIKNSSLPALPLELLVIEFCSPKEIPNSNSNKDSETKNNLPKNKVAYASKPDISDEKSLKKNSEKKPSLKKNEADLKITGNDSEASIDKKNKEEEENSPEQKDKEVKITDLNAVIDSWPKILERMKELQPALLSILKVCSPVKIEDETLIISTPFKFHQEKLNEAKNRTIFCTELKTATGLEKICVLEDKAVKVESAKKEELVDQVKNLLNL